MLGSKSVIDHDQERVKSDLEDIINIFDKYGVDTISFTDLTKIIQSACPSINTDMIQRYARSVDPDLKDRVKARSFLQHVFSDDALIETVEATDAGVLDMPSNGAARGAVSPKGTPAKPYDMVLRMLDVPSAVYCKELVSKRMEDTVRKSRQRWGEELEPWQQDTIFQCLTYEQLATVSKDVKVKFDDILEKLVAFLNKTNGGKRRVVLKAGVKSAKRGKKKCRVKYGGDASQMSDMVRATILVVEGTIHDLYDVVEEALSMPLLNTKVAHFSHFEDRYQAPKGDYRDILTLLRIRNFVCEVQFNLQAISDVKESSAGHVYYEQERLANDDLLISTINNDTAAAMDALRRNANAKRLSESRHRFNTLHFAAFHNNPEMLRLLLCNGADPYDTDNESRLPLHRAVQMGNWDAIQTLLHHMDAKELAAKLNKHKAMQLVALREYISHDTKVDFENRQREGEMCRGELYACDAFVHDVLNLALHHENLEVRLLAAQGLCHVDDRNIMELLACHECDIVKIALCWLPNSRGQPPPNVLREFLYALGRFPNLKENTDVQLAVKRVCKRACGADSDGHDLFELGASLVQLMDADEVVHKSGHTGLLTVVDVPCALDMLRAAFSLSDWPESARLSSFQLIFLGYAQDLIRDLPPSAVFLNPFMLRQACLASSQVPILGFVPETRCKGNVFFDAVEFALPGEENILNGLTFEVKSGTSVVLASHEGYTEKRACAELLWRFEDRTGGRIFLDGRDIHEYHLPWLRSQIVFLDEWSELFPMTIRENLTIGCAVEPSLEQIEDMCKLVNVWDAICEQPQGLETRLTNAILDTLPLSQIKQLCIVRTLLCDPAILIVHNFQEGLEMQGVIRVKEALKHVMKGRTTIITSRFAGFWIDADNIIVLNDGAVDQEGTHQELMRVPGEYRSLMEKIWFYAFGVQPHAITTLAIGASKLAEHGYTEEAAALEHMVGSSEQHLSTKSKS